MKISSDLSKTVLSVYKYLPNVTRSIDKLISVKGVESCHYNKDGGSDIFKVSSYILELMNRKVNLINLKIIIEKTLKQINKENARILIYKYFDNLKAEDIAANCKISDRTYFRKLNDSLLSFSCSLSALGYDMAAVMKLVEKENWIIKILHKFETQKELCGNEKIESKMALNFV